MLYFSFTILLLWGISCSVLVALAHRGRGKIPGNDLHPGGGVDRAYESVPVRLDKSRRISNLDISMRMDITTFLLEAGIDLVRYFSNFHVLNIC